MSELLAHLDRQVRSSRSLLGIVLAQSAAIRERDVDAILARLAEIQGEMGQRAQLEGERERLIGAAAAQLGIPTGDVDLEAMLELEDPSTHAVLRGLSAELKGLVAETARMHEQNRILIRQELSFVDHLMRLLSGGGEGAYSPRGATHVPQIANAVNATA